MKILLPITVLVVAWLLFLSVSVWVVRKSNAYLKACGGVHNSDFGRYVFRLTFDEAEALDRLFVPNATDVLEYTIDVPARIIRFYYLNGTYPYRLSFAEKDGQTFLLVAQKTITGGRPHGRITPFFIQKLGAEPVDYQTFISLFMCKKI